MEKLYLSKSSVASGTEISVLKTNIENAQKKIADLESKKSQAEEESKKLQERITAISEEIGSTKSKQEYEHQRAELKKQRDLFDSNAKKAQQQFGDVVLDAFPPILISRAVAKSKVKLQLMASSETLPNGITEPLISYLTRPDTNVCVCGRPLCSEEKEHVRSYLKLMPPRSYASMYQNFCNIESLMPSGLSNFFFFDGEKIAELAVEETSEQMKDSIKTLLGISVIDSLQSDLQRVVSRIEKQQTATANSEQIDKLRVERDEAAKKLAEAEEELADLKKQREKTIQKIESKREEYSAKGGDIYTQRQQLYSKRTGITSRIEALSERLVTDAASELPLLLVRHLLEKIKQKAESEHEQKLLGSTLAKLENLFTEYDNADLMDRAAIQRFIDYVRSTAEPGTGHVFAELSDSSVSKLQVLLDSQLDANRKDVLQRKLELAELQAQMDQLDNYLSVEIDEEAINQIYRKIKELEQEQIALDVKIQGKEEECRTLNGKSMAAASAFKRNLEEYIRKAEFNDDGERVLKYAHMASTILSEYTNRLQQRKVAAVADTMTECYKQLANKTSLIHHIEMDPTTLDLKYIGPDGKEVDRASLSAGEKQLMVISLLWALGRCSKKKLPVIIDTPLSRLDSAHRSSVIQTYFPQASDQTIILSTDTEIDQSYYELMRPNIGDEFTLIYNDETKSTTISSGYFPGV